ncbi:MAG: MBL fold metallo-hydrolase [Cyanobacteria bacterium P01_F01_bin.150]
MSGVNSKLNTFPTSPSYNHAPDDYSPAFSVRFWGVRGSIPTSSPNTVFYGGNTPCVELLVNGKRLIFDGGTGLRMLGEELCNGSPVEAHLFLTHTQIDRIQGFPFFRPAFYEENQVHIYGPQSTTGASIKHTLEEHMIMPRFHVPLHHMRAALSFKTLQAGTSLDLDGVSIQAMALNSDNASLGYRVTWKDYAVVYATDSYGPEAQQVLSSLGTQADLVIFDAVQARSNYYDPRSLNTLNQLSTWRKSLDTVTGLDAKQVVLSCLAPSHEDAFLRQLENEVRAIYPNVQIAQEGNVVTVGHCLEP